MAYLTQTIRLTPMEFAAVKNGAAALGKLEVSKMIATAAVEAAHRLGFFHGTTPAIRAKPGAWKDAPRRSEEEGSAKEKVTFSIHPMDFELVERAAKAMHVDPLKFCLGATFRFLATQKHNDPKNKALAAVELPEQYVT